MTHHALSPLLLSLLNYSAVRRTVSPLRNMVKIGRRRSSTPLRKALLVGIGYVDAASPDFPPLSHAHSDTEALRDLLISTCTACLFRPSSNT